MSTRSKAYICTLFTYDEEKIATIRDSVVKTNLYYKQYGISRRYRLMIHPRLGKNNPYKHLYAQGGSLHRPTSQDIKREHGSRFDLYLYRR